MNQFTASLWGDEAFAAILSQKSLIDIVRIVSKDTSPPLYYFSSHIWMRIFGTSEVAIRSLSFLFFLGAVLGVYFIGKHLWEKKTGFLAAILCFLNPFLFRYGFEGRMYSILLTGCIWSVYFFLRLKEDLNNKKYLIAYVLATVAALYSHHFSIFLVFLEFVWLLALMRKKFWLAFRPFLLTGILYLPWLNPLYYQTSLVAGGFWLGKPKLIELFYIYRNFLTEAATDNLKKLIITCVIALLFLRKKWQKMGLFLGAWCLLPILITFLVSQFKSSIFFDRYLLYVIPPLMLLLASQLRKVSWLPLFLLMLIWLKVDYDYLFHPTKLPFRELVQYIEVVKRDEDKLINYNGKAHHLWETKYYRLEVPLYAPGPLPFFVGTALMTKEDTIEELPEVARLGVITSDDPVTVQLPNFVQGEIKQFDRLAFIWFYRD